MSTSIDSDTFARILARLHEPDALAIIKVDEMALEEGEDPWVTGGCLYLASALARHVGGKVMVFVRHAPGSAPYSWGHAFVQVGSVFLDGRGFHENEHALRKAWGASSTREFKIAPFSHVRDDEALHGDAAIQRRLFDLLQRHAATGRAAGVAKKVRFTKGEVGTRWDYVVAGTPAALEFGLDGPVACLNCGQKISHVYMTDVGPLGGDCLATISGDDSTRRVVRAIRDKISYLVRDFYDYRVSPASTANVLGGASAPMSSRLDAKDKSTRRDRLLGVFKAHPKVVGAIVQALLEERYDELKLVAPTVSVTEERT